MEHISLIYQLHSPEELVRLSNYAHWAEGGMFLLVVIFSLLNIFFGKYKPKLGFVWPTLVLLSGLFLFVFSYSHHYNEMALAWKATWTDGQQRQHFYMGVLITLAGLGELIALKLEKSISVFKFFLPISLSLIGILFLTHPQHGTSEAVVQAKMIHNYLGVAILLSGVFKFAEVLWSKKAQWLLYPWIVFLAIAAVLLVGYREPEGAYRLAPDGQTTQHEMH